MTEQQFDVVIVGAGFGGIGAAIQLKRLGYDNLVILDREDDLGGTWHVNRYPGLAVDVPTTTYSYWFEPNPNWSRLFAPGAELKQYADHVADKYDVRRYMRFNTAVEGARWDDDAQVWRVALADGETLTSRFLITATGFLSQPNTPDIPGVTSFEGRIIHTTAWDDGYDPASRRIADHRHRGHRGAAHPRAREEGRRPDRLSAHPDLGGAQDRRADLADSAKRLFARVPVTQRAIRWITDSLYEFFVYVGLHHRSCSADDSLSAQPTWPRCTASRRSATRNCGARLTPDYDFGCKRPTFSNVYYRTFTKPHVHLQTAGIDRIEPDGIVANDGTKAVIDTLVLATGFDLWEANFPAIEVIGREGRNLGKWWRDTRFQAYQGVSMPYFPNFLSLASPFAFARVELLQHDGIPDAAHGSAVRRAQRRSAHARSRSPRTPTPGSSTG